MTERRHPVVAAGLMGATALALPVQAGALTVFDVVDMGLSSPVATFSVGVGVGALVTAGIASAVSAARRRRDERSEEVSEEPSSTYAPRHMRVADSNAEPTSSREEQADGHDASHAATNYEDIAENYVKRATFRERMALRAGGVAATLRDRMGANMMDGIPVIERADGSVGDVGTSWWRNAVGGDTLSRDADFAEQSVDLAIPSDFTMSDRDRLVTSAGLHVSSIASRVAFVDEGAYPERRTVDDLDNSDAWELALRSLDEKIASVAPTQDPIGFIDSVGGPDSLDEPDNLELQTAFIPFKTPGGHPEVVDTDTYVDYLIEDEITKNSSTAVRKRFLRLLEGGTQTNARRLSDTSTSDPVYVGKHFSVPQAAEA